VVIRWERGLRRVTILASAVLLIIGLWVSALWAWGEKPGWLLYLGGVLLAVVIATVPWLLFFLGRWLVRGFIAD
jgi:hypothetical protein